MSILSRLLKLERLQPNEDKRPLTMSEFRNLAAGHTAPVIHAEPFPLGYIPSFAEFKAELSKIIEREKLI
ncbi:MAG: hypothetical protein WCS87_02990 [Methylococcaceae bacterium]